jgi:polysaccharide deacetylase 2 family uncharacterized protein YibQ
MKKTIVIISVFLIFLLIFGFFGKKEEEKKEIILPKGIIKGKIDYLKIPEKKQEQIKRELKTKFVKKEKNYKTSLIAIIIDDMGTGREIEKEILEIKYPLTLSFMPTNFSKSYNLGKNFEILLHQPMEPENPNISSGEKAITTRMTPEEIKNQLRENLKDVPLAVGVNNHMGSLATSNKEVMLAVLEVIKEKNLFFVDSKTSKNSCGYSLAKSLNIPSLERDVFLDGKRDKDYIREKFLLLQKISKEKGYAVGIIHPHKESIAVLKEVLPEIEKEGIKLVHISKLVR